METAQKMSKPRRAKGTNTTKAPCALAKAVMPVSDGDYLAAVKKAETGDKAAVDAAMAVVAVLMRASRQRSVSGAG